MKRETLIEELRDAVAVITLNRPERRNAFNNRLYDDTRAALAEARDDDRVHAVLITGAAGAFSAGQDIGEMGSGHAFAPFVDELSSFDKPLLAAVNGVAVGIGLTMLLHCDVVYVGESARLRAPFVSLGLVPEAGSSLLLPLVVGPQRAAEVLFTNEWINASRAVEIGLAARALPDFELLPAALAKAAEIAAQPLAALRHTKQLLLACRADALHVARARENQAMAARMGSPENVAAIRAFRERRGAKKS
jgi:enoyl-CoA hydratase/carnithine racemase